MSRFVSRNDDNDGDRKTRPAKKSAGAFFE